MSQRLQLLDGLEREAGAGGGCRQFELERQGHALRERHAFRRGEPPADEEAPAVGHVVERLAGVDDVRRAQLSGQPFRLGGEGGAVEGADRIFGVGTKQHPFFLGGIAIDGQLEKVRTFVEIPARARGRLAGLVDAGGRPLLQVG